jgi:ABC-type Mn2+/Zn2+ transport system permease subunit
VPATMLIAASLGAASVACGLLLSWHLGTAAGATIAGVAVLVFFAVLLGRDVRRQRGGVPNGNGEVQHGDP